MADKIETSQDTESKQEQVYNYLKQDILEGKFPPGAPMVERKLCDIYHVSRSPVRNALQRLIRDGLVAFVPGKATMIDDKAKYSTFRMNYSNASEENIEKGIKILGEVLH
ncbi:MAG: GntR family transcriptional regulator, partial [Lachnospiraceae bacterium]|nr:GntR family transcriptional regulator [Lachnospiraceae bacterium]